MQGFFHRQAGRLGEHQAFGQHGAIEPEHQIRDQLHLGRVAPGADIKRLGGQAIPQIVAGREGGLLTGDERRRLSLASLFARTGERCFQVLDAAFGQTVAERGRVQRVAGACVQQDLPRLEPRIHLLENLSDLLRREQAENDPLAIASGLSDHCAPREQGSAFARVRLWTRTG